METPVHQFGSPELPEPSTLPVLGDSTDFGKGYSQSEFFFDLCFNVSTKYPALRYLVLILR